MAGIVSESIYVEVAVWMGEVLIGVYRVPMDAPRKVMSGQYIEALKEASKPWRARAETSQEDIFRLRLDALFEHLPRSERVAKTYPPDRQWWGGSAPKHLNPDDKRFVLR